MIYLPTYKGNACVQLLAFVETNAMFPPAFP